jgi:hypothetical protein
MLIIFGVLPLSRCGSGYKEKDGKVTFNGNEINDEHFVVLNNSFAKNDTAAYYKGYTIHDADIKTFVNVDDHYAKDIKNVFYCDEERDGQTYFLTKHSVIIKLKDAHCNSFMSLGGDYAKDNRRGYYKGIGFEVGDVATLTTIDGQFIKDKDHIYFERKVVKKADVNSFRTINNSYAKDTARVYHYGYHSNYWNGIHEVPCNVAFFKLLEYPYSIDNESAFYVYTKIKGSDAGSFLVVGNGFSKDKNHVYNEAEILAGADPATFLIFSQDENSLEEFSYSKDKDHVFFEEKMLPQADLASFTIKGLGYSSDSKNVYYHTLVVKNADPATFKVYEHGYGDADSEDSKNKYLKGVRVSQK